MDGVLWINDSKSTNITSTEVAVAALDRPFVLLLGGRHKGEPYTRLAAPLAGRCRAVVAYGEAGPLIVRDLGDRITVVSGGDFADVLARGAGAGPAGRRGAAVAGLLQLRHVQELRGAGRPLPGRGGGDVTAPRPVRHPGELRWETRLLGMVTVVLLVFGVAATYGAASLVTVRGQNVGLGFAARQVSGAFIGGLLLLWASRQDYYRWRDLAWPVLLVTIGIPPDPAAARSPGRSRPR